MYASHAHHAASRHSQRDTQRGVTLLVVMIMLIVIGLVSASAMRQAANADLISNNARLEHFAKQSAETALRYCEAQITGATGTPAIQIQPASDTAPAWKTLGNWTGSNKKAIDVPADRFKSADTSAPTPSQAPQCLVEYSPLGNNVYIVTARGFSPDFQEDSSTGRTKRGSVVWLQSTLASS